VTTITQIPNEIDTDVSESRSLTITAVGDIMLDRRLLPPRTFMHIPDVSTCGSSYEGQVRFPFINDEQSVRWLTDLDRHVHGVRATAHYTQSEPLRLPADGGDYDYPFRKIKDALKQSNIVFGNLECPLSTRGRRINNDSCYSADPNYAGAMAEAGFRVMSFANNHCFDYGENAFHDTLDALRNAGITPVGAGATLAEARKPAILRVNGATVAFLAYSMIGFPSVWATENECGAAPMNPMMFGQDIRRVRRQADVVVLSVHWGVETRAVPYPRIVDLAHDCIDNGADVILGHHPHVPGSVEMYRGRPIFYSLGNFIFGHEHEEWSDGIMARLHIERGALAKVETIPITGRYQPEVATGDAAEAVQQRVAEASRRLQSALARSANVESARFA
jgi:poly-gamma-glutamate synthesis protein (capsule biosynthesis protein)